MANPRGTVTRITSPHAKQLRANMTDAEHKLWHHVRDRRLANAKFRKQASIHPFVADFLCVEKRLIVEVDGGQHGADVDAARTAFLISKGYRVIRFWNNEVLNNISGVLEAIRTELESPLPLAGEGQLGIAKQGEGTNSHYPHPRSLRSHIPLPQAVEGDKIKLT